MSSRISSSGKVTQLDKRAEPDEQVTIERVSDAERLVRLLMDLLRDVTLLKRRWWPQFIDFDGVVTTGDDVTPSTHRFAHNFGGPVRFWIVDLASTTSANSNLLVREDSSDANTLVLSAYFPATISLRIEQAGG